MGKAVYNHVCEVCSKTFSNYVKSQIFCSIKCSSSRYALTVGDQRSCSKCGETKLLSNFYSHGTRPSGSRHYKHCKSCEKKHEDKHSKATRQAKRYAIKKATSTEQINPFVVFEKHNWTCCNCGVDTPKELRGSNERNSPELDHIIPLSKGGTHTYDNVQLLCKFCNNSKSNKYHATTRVRANVLSQQAG